MGGAAQISLEQYLRHPTEPESEYIQGEVFQKALGTNLHARLQGRLIRLLFRWEELGVGLAVPEQSLRLREDVILIPDVCVLRADNIETGVVTHPPLLCIEILSLSDRFAYTARKCKEYLSWGVPACWILDPEASEAWVSDSAGVHPVAEGGRLEAGSISLGMLEIFPSSAH
jgi:Uma2 family endonuclease